MDENKLDVQIEKLLPSGQGLAALENGKKVFVWNALPGEKVRIRLLRQKQTYAEAIADEIKLPSADRTPPRDTHFLATSPWEIMTFEAENRYKRNIIEDLFQGFKIELPAVVGTTHDNREWHYRNKMEYSFWGDETGLHLALHHRGSHGKQIVTGSSLAMPEIDKVAENIRVLLEKLQVRAGDLKTIIVRSTQMDNVAASLFVKNEAFNDIKLPDGLQGLHVYYSNPKSPASVLTKLLYEYGDCTLYDHLLGKKYAYDTDSFFQVNVPVFELALDRIKTLCGSGDVVDMYAGVGSIGLSVARRCVDLVELDPATAKMARINAASSGLETRVVEASTEKALSYVNGLSTLILDPPRAGLHDKLITEIMERVPPEIIYLSCNPITQARDLLKLLGKYRVDYFEVFNFFPRTPHIETLAVLRKTK